MKRHILAAAFLILICGCSRPPVMTEISTTPSPTAKTAVNAPKIEASPTPSELPDESQIKAPTAADVYAGLMENDVLNYILPNTYEKDENSRAYETISASKDATLQLPQRYMEWMKDSANNLIGLEIRNVKTTFTPPAWALLGTLVYNYSDDVDALRRALNLACVYEIGVYRDKGGFRYEISAKPRDFNELFYMLPDNGRVTPFSNLFTYAYLQTVYDEHLQPRDGIEQPELPELLFPIGGNLDDYYVGDTWYDSRDSGLRRHTGTDINAPEGTALYAVTDGGVFDAGSAEGTGNYIIIEAGDGTQYHYYHMVEPPALKRGDAVSKGDIVGYVGNTGNSTANHLHMAIITDDGYYLNPYAYLKDAYDRAKNTITENSGQKAPEQHGE